MKNLYLLIFSLFLFACSSEEEPDMLDTTMITINSFEPAQGPYCVGETLMFSLELRSDAQVGLGSFEIDKNGEQLFFKNDYTANISRFNYTYEISNTDFDLDILTFTFRLTDGNGTSVTKSQMVDVETAYGFFQEMNLEELAWSFTSNSAVSVDDPSADFTRNPPGPFVNNIIWTPTNNSRFYAVNPTRINNLDFSIKADDIINEIISQTPLDLINIVGGDVRLPLVVDIGGSGNFAIIDNVAPANPAVNYRKLSESSGR